MYAIYAYIDPPNHPNVGIYSIHGAPGIGNEQQIQKLPKVPTEVFLNSKWRKILCKELGLRSSLESNSSHTVNQEHDVNELRCIPEAGSKSCGC